MLQISHGHLSAIQQRMQSLQARMKNAKEKSQHVVTTAVRTAEVGASAFTFGVIQGKYGGAELLGVPVDLGAAVLLHLGGFLGLGGEAIDNHLHAFGDGALASYLVTIGRGVGKNWGKGKTKMSGDTGGMDMTDAELSRLASR